jgi:hypothetical protein
MRESTCKARPAVYTLAFPTVTWNVEEAEQREKQQNKKAHHTLSTFPLEDFMFVSAI